MVYNIFIRRFYVRNYDKKIFKKKVNDVYNCITVERLTVKLKIKKQLFSIFLKYPLK